MPKYLLITDSHLGINHASDLYHDIVYNIFVSVKQICYDRGISTILHLGDFFHDRKELNTKTINTAKRIAELFEGTGITMHIIAGNHDVYYKDKLVPSTLEIFHKYKNIVTIFDIEEISEGIVLCPWGMLPSGFRDSYCFGHFEFIGFKMNNSYVCNEGADYKEVKGFKHIYSGHFHTPSSKDNITYLGSPYQQDFNDVGSDRGYYIWEDGELEFIKNEVSPRFVKIFTNNLDFTNVNGNIVKLIFTEDFGSIKNQQFIDEMLSFNPIKHQIDFSQIKLEGTDDTLESVNASLLDHREIITEYISRTTLPDHIRKDTLLRLIDKLKNEFSV